MRTLRVSIFIMGILILAGCLPSIHPLYTDQDLREDERLVGVWEDPMSEDQWVFTQKETQLYQLEAKTGNFNSSDLDTTILDIRLLELKGQMFLDFYPGEDPALEQISSMMQMHLVPAHTFARIELTTDSLIMWRLNPEWLEKALENKQETIAHEVADDMIVLTASTAELQAFVIRNLDNPAAFMDPELMLRVKE